MSALHWRIKDKINYTSHRCDMHTVRIHISRLLQYCTRVLIKRLRSTVDTNFKTISLYNCWELDTHIQWVWTQCERENFHQKNFSTIIFFNSNFGFENFFISRSYWTLWTVWTVWKYRRNHLIFISWWKVGGEFRIKNPGQPVSLPQVVEGFLD